MEKPCLEDNELVLYDVIGTNFQTDKAKRAYTYVPNVKRTFDIFVSFAGLIFLLPLFLLVAVAIKLEDGGPIIHTRICVGQNKKPFKMYKFRSMKVDADNLLYLFASEERKKYARGEKLYNDPRVTRIGNIIRKMSIDELPQLFSILKGDMSIVGPRPVIQREADSYGNLQDQLLSVKPGLTGVWQVSGRGSIPYLCEEAQALQLSYIDKAGFFFDMKIILQTVKVVLNRKGAR